MAAQEASEASVTGGTSSSNPNLWDIHPNPGLSSWMSSPWQPQNHRQQQPISTCCDEGISVSSSTSFPNLTPNHSCLTATSDDSSAEPVDHHLWNHLLLGVGGNARAGGGGGGNLPGIAEGHHGKLLEAAIFDPATNCDYQSWSIAPPQRQLDAMRIETVQDSSSSSSYVGNTGFAMQQCYENVHPQQQGGTRQVMGGAGYQVGLKEALPGGVGSGCKYSGIVGVQDTEWSTSTKNFTDLISFGSSLNKAMVFPTSSRGLDLPEVRKHTGHEPTSSSTRRNAKGSIGNGSEGKSKRSEDSQQENSSAKKPKHETSKLQLPKVKLADKITALQQMVSPFGKVRPFSPKTDTASVLLEAINSINILHQEIQLRSDPYLKSGGNKEQGSWGGLEGKNVAERKVDLRSKGLCLVPTSYVPQVCLENAGSDYLNPIYRGCLYR